MGNCCFKDETEPSVTGQRGAGASGQAAGGGDPGGGGGGKPPLPKSKRGLNKEQQSALNALYQEGLIECEVSDSNIRSSSPHERAEKCANGRGMSRVAHAPQNGSRGSTSQKPRPAHEWQPEFNRTASSTSPARAFCRSVHVRAWKWPTAMYALLLQNCLCERSPMF
jgi:hypothetical protein